MTLKPKIARLLTAALTAAALAAAAWAGDFARFYGNWENPAHDESGIRHVVLSPAGGNRVSMRVYGDCHPNECDWGVVPADPAGGTPKTGPVNAVTALIHYGFAHRRITVGIRPDGSLWFKAEIRYVENAGKRDRTVTGRLKASHWAGPMSKASWEQPVASDAGWGGGARGSVLAKPKEICDGFDPATLALAPAGKGWAITASGKTLIWTGHGIRDARQALATLNHYRFDKRCHTGTMAFWKIGNGFPAEKMTGATCLEFDSTTAHVARIGKSWQVVNGSDVIADMNVSRDNAYAVLAMIRRYRLEKKCVVAWPNPTLIYWLGD